jgi:hypothetical protein
MLKHGAVFGHDPGLVLLFRMSNLTLGFSLVDRRNDYLPTLNQAPKTTPGFSLVIMRHYSPLRYIKHFFSQKIA